MTNLLKSLRSAAATLTCIIQFWRHGNGTLLSGRKHFSHASEDLHHHLGVSAFAEYTVAARQSVVKIDFEFSLEIAAVFGCAVMTGVGAILNTAELKPGASCAVFGMGGVGLSSVMGARAAGAYPIIAIDVLDDKLAIAKDVGATHVVNAAKDNPVEAIRDVTGGGADYCIEVVGSEQVLLQAYESSARGGTTVTVGLPHPGKMLTLSAVSLVADEKTIKGSYMGLGRVLQFHMCGETVTPLTYLSTLWFATGGELECLPVVAAVTKGRGINRLTLFALSPSIGKVHVFEI